MVLIPVQCSHCHSDHVIKGGITKAGKQRGSVANMVSQCFEGSESRLMR